MKLGRKDHASRPQALHGPVLFSFGFRPFFLGAALFAGVAVPAWVAMLVGDRAPFSAARVWHVHEMLFGFLPAVMTGFLLTALPNWTARPPLQGRQLQLLFALWLAGRFAMAIPAFPPALSALVDGSFLIVLAGLIWRELVAAGSWSHGPVGVVIGLYACANITFHGLSLNREETDLPIGMALALIMLLLTLLGGRLVPNFTREFLAGQGNPEQPAAFSHFDVAAIGSVAIAGLVWMLLPQSRMAGWLFVAAGVMNAGRLLRWCGWLTWREPLVFILHWGYAWLVLGMWLVGGALLGIGLPQEDAVHALTAGAVGVMTLGVMTRATLGHTGRPRQAGPATLSMYVLVTVGAILRVFGPGTGLSTTLVLGFAAAGWSGAYLLFAAVYGPFLLRPGLEE